MSDRPLLTSARPRFVESEIEELPKEVLLVKNHHMEALARSQRLYHQRAPWHGNDGLYILHSYEEIADTTRKWPTTISPGGMTSSSSSPGAASMPATAA